MITTSKKSIPIGMLLIVLFMLIFMFRFVQVTLEKEELGNLSYIQLINSGVPLIKSTYYNEDAYYESTVTIKTLVLEALNIKELNPIDLVMNEIPYFSSMSSVNSVEKPTYLDNFSNMSSFNLDEESIDKIPEKPPIGDSAAYDPSLKRALDQSKPQVLIYHTHTTEAYNGEGQSADPNNNVVGVGELVARELEENYGISVIHDKTNHSVSYNDAYYRSEESVKSYLNKYGSFELIIDLHRDSIRKDAVTAEINGESVARLMPTIAGNGAYYNSINSIEQFIIDKGNELFPGLMRRGEPYYINPAINKLNQSLSDKSILIEVGANTNEAQEAMNSAKYIARLIAEYINGK